MPSFISRFLHLSVGLCLAVLLASCGGFPADPNGTLDRVEGGELRVGVSHSPPFAVLDGSREPAGSEVDLVRDFAASLDAEVRWTAAGEESLLDALGEGELDLVIGGISDNSPWTDKGALTRPYREVPGPGGTARKLVFVAPLGENAYLMRLERFLQDSGDGQ